MSSHLAAEQVEWVCVKRIVHTGYIMMVFQSIRSAAMNTIAEYIIAINWKERNDNWTLAIVSFLNLINT